MEQEVMQFDVLIVGAGPAGLAAACRLKQQAQDNGRELSVCVLEKGSEVGAHILSGAIIDPRALAELFPDWQQREAPLTVAATRDDIVMLRNERQAVKVPKILAPKTMHNEGCYIASLGNVSRWLARQAEAMGVEIFPGFAAAEVLYDEQGRVKGVLTGDMGVGADNMPKDSHMPGMALEARFTLFAEGCRGHLGKALIQRYSLDADSDPQHYGLGIKELWDIDPEKHQPGLVIHGSGWPLQDGTGGGFFLYHTDNAQVAVGLIVDLNYSNPWLSPFEEFQRLKHHPYLEQYLEGGKRVAYGARALAKGGFNSLPKMQFPGGLLIGCDAGTLNAARIKGTHTAMKSGMLAAEAVFDAIEQERAEADDFETRFRQSWLYDELYRARNFSAALHKFGPLLGGAFNTLEQNLFAGRLPLTLHERDEDHAGLKEAAHSRQIRYPKPDGRLSFDRASSVYLSNTNHEEDQPCHLQLNNRQLSLSKTLPLYQEPAQRYCPAGVYEIVLDEAGQRLQINAQNCLHCKTCDIKDPCQNIQWLPPEGAGGPNYPNM